jgi:murein DD-endopeptidase MepM/ murein hydrolase activator NlpD
MFLLGFYLITLLNLETVLLPESMHSSVKNREEIKKLNEKIIYLAYELEKLQLTNNKLKSIFEKQDSLNKVKPLIDTLRKKTQGNIFYVIIELFRKYFLKDQEKPLFIKPTEGIISNKFDPSLGHLGIDISAKVDSPIFASSNGYVSFAGYTPEYGNEIILVHSNNFITKYKHCSVLIKKIGDKVLQGELIALVGNTGIKSHGNHLHFEIWHNGKVVNPESYLHNF